MFTYERQPRTHPDLRRTAKSCVIPQYTYRLIYTSLIKAYNLYDSISNVINVYIASVIESTRSVLPVNCGFRGA